MSLDLGKDGLDLSGRCGALLRRTPLRTGRAAYDRIRLKQALKAHGQPEWLVSVVHCRRASGGSERG
jgi:hypothetical protein